VENLKEENENEDELNFLELFTLMIFRTEALENLLFNKGIIDKKEFTQEVINISLKGESQKTKDKIKRYMESNY
jgi:hypothetical protein